MAMELVFLVTIIASLGGLFLWVARSMASSLGQRINRRFRQRSTVMVRELLRPSQARF